MMSESEENGAAGKTSQEILLTVKGETEAIRGVLENLEAVDTVEFTGITEDNFAKVKVHSKSREDIREQIFYVLADAKLPIMEMSHVQKSLEDIFLELTGIKAEEVQAEAEQEKEEE